ncbi:ABC transporter permease [Cellulomonas dongxiuzhuiae]|uniref:ABC transporter permease n=1 Tax=Cellulomonas dongxiuzhuiae TaxID=2819979 RepID=A0ABX8GJU4_9CELL|nr:ABC transporter permease [Cellulomonas dongxiuzhuiae]MBO3089536.1 ABC transporter permease [Cellulomonas dongxiuzhuiae]MBO3095172.1 ABC transporter permease [Cellulomonas dongxiuzhuiae]QWC16175.1 ABC transporter permease [Cellulomonas dongxiuzhuiae]
MATDTTSPAVPPTGGAVESPRRVRERRDPRRVGVLRRTLRTPGGVVGLTVTVLMVGLGLLAPVISPADPVATAFDQVLRPPSGEHLLGTDELGRDQLSRVLHGIAASIQIGLLSVVLATAVGVPLGLAAGYYRRIDPLISRAVDVLLAFPTLILAVGLAAVLGPSATNVTIALAVTAVPAFVRVVRSEVMRLRGMEFVSSAVASGVSDTRVLWVHILPNAMSALLVQITVSIPTAVIGEATLSFLGLGIRPPEPSLGTMLSNAQAFLATGWWMALFPGIAVIAITLALNLVGDALRDALDPKGRRR